MHIFISGQKAFGAAVFDLVAGLGHEIAGTAAPLYASDGVHTDRLRFAAGRADVLCLEPQALNADKLPAGVDLIISAHSHAFIGRKTRHKEAKAREERERREARHHETDARGTAHRF